MIEYVSSIWRIRHFWLALVRNDLRNRYRRSVLGVGWSLLHPIAMTAILCFVFVRVFHADVRTYAPFLLTGLVTWDFLVAAMSGGCQCFFSAESYIRQHRAPLAIYPLRVVLGAGIHFLLGMAIVLILVWAVNGPGNLAALPSLVPSLILLFVLAWALAVCMGVLNVMFQDWQHLLEIIIQIMFYATPIIYPAELFRQRNLGVLVSLNPLGAILDLIRQPILDGCAPSWGIVAAAAIGTAVITLVATLVLWRFERRLIFFL